MYNMFKEGDMQIAATKWINPSVLKWARERLGLSLEDVERLSEKLGKFYTPIRAEQLRQWERGASAPDLEHLEALSEVYVCPAGYFFLPEPPQESLPLSFRGLSPEKAGKLSPLSQQTLRRFLLLVEWTVSLIEDQRIEWETRIQPQKPSDVDVLVRQEKRRLGYTPARRASFADADEAFLWWRKKIEGQGVFCFQMKLEPGEIRGASAWLKARYPFILVNHQDVEAATGRIFTLLHEYAHLITAKDGLVCDFRGMDPRKGPEPFANRFAARMLLSYDEVKRRLKELGKYHYSETWADQLLDEIREPFFVSRDVVAIALQEMGLAPEDFYQKKREQWDKRKPWGRGGRRNLTKRERKLREIGFSLARILSLPGREGSVPLTDLSYVLDMKVEKVREFLTWVRDKVGSLE